MRDGVAAQVLLADPRAHVSQGNVTKQLHPSQARKKMPGCVVNDTFLTMKEEQYGS